MKIVSVIIAFVALILAFVIGYYAILISCRPYSLIKITNINKWKFSLLYGGGNSISGVILLLAITLNNYSESSINFFLQCFLPLLIISVTSMTVMTRIGIETQILAYKTISNEIKSDKRSFMFKLRKRFYHLLGQEMIEFYDNGYNI
jgi:hypothetical protein